MTAKANNNDDDDNNNNSNNKEQFTSDSNHGHTFNLNSSSTIQQATTCAGGTEKATETALLNWRS